MSNASDALKDKILENAAGPASAASDSQSVRQHSLRDQIEAHRLRAADAALTATLPPRCYFPRRNTAAGQKPDASL